MEKCVDLHVHTTASDGTFTPADVVHQAKKSGLSAIAITDHDTISGVEQAQAAGWESGIEVLPGIEFSTRYQGMVHLLGYGIDTKNGELNSALDGIVKDRDSRNRKVVEVMRQDGLDITYDQMQQRFGSVIGRPHFARILVECGLATDVSDAFSRFVGKGMRYWAPRTTLSIDRCIELIIHAGGVPVIAHPFEYGYDPGNLESLVLYCLEQGVRGIEVRHPSHTKEQMERLESLIKTYSPHCLMTGGSDFHGTVKPHNYLGQPEVPYAWYERVKEAISTPLSYQL